MASLVFHAMRHHYALKQRSILHVGLPVVNLTAHLRKMLGLIVLDHSQGRHMIHWIRWALSTGYIGCSAYLRFLGKESRRATDFVY